MRCSRGILALILRIGRLICYTAPPMDTKTLIITGVRDQARITRSFDLRPKDPGDSGAFDFIPGQVGLLRVKTEDPAYFAFASAPDDPDLEVLVKQKAGCSSVLYDMKPGEEIESAWYRRSRLQARRDERDAIWFLSRWVLELRRYVRHCATC